MLVNRNSGTMNLICFPYAGGSKYSYGSFKSAAPKGINVVPIELPGRGDRFMEPLLVDINSMVEDLFDQLKGYIHKPYVLYGHSMGALLSWLTAKKIANANLPLPQQLIITGCEGPSVKDESEKLRSQLPPDEFIEELKILGGISHDILQDKSFLEFFEPILRTDFKAIEGYKYLKSAPLNIPVCVIYGSEEEITPEEASCWQEEFNLPVEVIQLPGDHFFIFKHEKKIMSIIENRISQRWYTTNMPRSFQERGTN